MIGARIKCDHCNFIGDMELTKNCRTTVAAPSGWAVVHATIRIKGERELSQDQLLELKKRVKALSPPFHICPRCIFGGWAPSAQRLLAGAPA